MNGLEEIVKENKKADKTNIQIKLEEQIVIKSASTPGTLVISHRGREIKLTTTVLRLMVATNKADNVWGINDRILSLLNR